MTNAIKCLPFPVKSLWHNSVFFFFFPSVKEASWKHCRKRGKELLAFSSMHTIFSALVK